VNALSAGLVLVALPASLAAACGGVFGDAAAAFALAWTAGLLALAAVRAQRRAGALLAVLLDDARETGEPEGGERP
jgi:hypothetical protein